MKLKICATGGAIWVALCAALLTSCASAPQAPMPTVAKVDLNRYLGKWYQVSLIPNSFQAQCVADTQAHYALQDTWTGDSIRVTNRCRTAAGAIDTAVGVAKIVPDSHNAKLKVAFFRPFYGNYWVLALGDDYDWVLVGEPKREFGWVLSRKPVLDEGLLNQALARAQALGYDKSQFVPSPQTQPLE
jgi:apolipoprotein D and lipocalin family protein